MRNQQTKFPSFRPGLVGYSSVIEAVTMADGQRHLHTVRLQRLPGFDLVRSKDGRLIVQFRDEGPAAPAGAGP